MVTTQSTISTQNAQDTTDGAQERPRWSVDTDWQAALEAARASGYTGRAVSRAAADELSERYGYR